MAERRLREWYANGSPYGKEPFMVANKAAGLKVGFPLYEGFDSLDVLGPFQTFTFAGMDCYLLGPTCSPVISFEGVSTNPRKTFDDCPKLDVLFVPGGSNPVEVIVAHPRGERNPYLEFLNNQAADAKLVCSVCTGALLLAAAGLLDGHTVTTHWAYKDVLRLFPCHVVDDYRRYVQSGNRITGGGISSGLDESFYIVSQLYGLGVARDCQLKMQYHPQPTFHCGDPGDSDIKDDPGMIPQVLADWHVADSIGQVSRWLGK
jgi:transcriptional regulator GlxA family with amidase domain